MKRALAVILAAGFAVGSYATDARVAVMGRQGTPYFYRDEVSVFINPADMSLYPNLIYGSFGWLSPTAESQNYTLKNTQPNDPLFGGMISYGFSDEESGPMLSIGAFVNRKDYMLDRLLDEGETGERAGQNDYNLVDPLGRVDLMLGYDIGNGLALGLGFYTAYQCELNNNFIRNQTAIYKVTGGINYNIDQGLDFELDANLGFMNARWMRETQTANLDSEVHKVAVDDWFLRLDGRIFSAVPTINGSLVPQISVMYITFKERTVAEYDLAAGMGINMNIDRGFFWTGLQGIGKLKQGGGSGDPLSIGGRLSFGIERNIVWDWFLIRVGGQKELRNQKKGETESIWIENPSSDGTDGDLVGLGFGINIDNRLRIDFVASEDLPYTLTNLISGAQHHLFNRVSATYRF